MTIPLIGLVHRVDIINYKEEDDGAGGLALDTDNPVNVYLKRRARVTVMSDEDEREGFGEASGRHWRVIIKYSPNIERSHFLRLSASSRKAPINTGIDYRIVYVKHQIDHLGRFHHTTLAIEKEEADG